MLLLYGTGLDCVVTTQRVCAVRTASTICRRSQPKTTKTTLTLAPPSYSSTLLSSTYSAVVPPRPRPSRPVEATRSELEPFSAVSCRSRTSKARSDCASFCPSRRWNRCVKPGDRVHRPIRHVRNHRSFTQFSASSPFWRVSLRYDMVRDGIFSCARKLTKGSTYSSAQRPNNGKHKETKNKNRVAQKKRSG